MMNKKVKVVSPFGVHARPAAKIAQLAQEANGAIWLIANGEKVDATCIMDILALCCITNTELEILAENEKDQPIVNQIVAFFAAGFGES